MKRTLVACMAALVCGSFIMGSSSALAGGDKDCCSDCDCARLGRRAGRGKRAEAMPGERLGLTKAQREKIKEATESQREEMQSLFEKISLERKELRELIHAEETDEKAIREKTAEIAKIEADRAIVRAKITREISHLLSAEQKQRMKELRDERQKRWSGRGGAEGLGLGKRGRVAKSPRSE